MGLKGRRIRDHGVAECSSSQRLLSRGLIRPANGKNSNELRPQAGSHRSVLKKMPETPAPWASQASQLLEAGVFWGHPTLARNVHPILAVEVRTVSRILVAVSRLGGATRRPT